MARKSFGGALFASKGIKRLNIWKQISSNRVYAMLLQNVLGSWPRECGNQIQNTQKYTKYTKANTKANTKYKSSSLDNSGHVCALVIWGKISIQAPNTNDVECRRSFANSRMQDAHYWCLDGWHISDIGDKVLHLFMLFRCDSISRLQR